jgi:hypothetical protein
MQRLEQLNQEVTIAILNAETGDRDLERSRRRAVELWERVLAAEQALVDFTPVGVTGEREIAERGVVSARVRLEELRHAGR